MGVVYKLTPHISSYIVDQKQGSPKISCQSLADKVFASFGQRVSKSSVHELLKQAHVITPRSRVIKEKFQIPQEKKTQISKDLASLMRSPLAQVSDPILSLPNVPDLISAKAGIQNQDDFDMDPRLKEPARLPAGSGMASVESNGDIFLKCALWDISFKPVLGLKDFRDIDSFNPTKGGAKMEWDYLTQLVYALKIELEDNRHFFIDGRFQDLYLQAPAQSSLAAPIERTACETADYILNNIAPLIIQEHATNGLDPVCYDLIAGFENLPGKSIRKVSLVNVRNQELAEFNVPIVHKRTFILGISPNCKEFQGVMDEQKKEFTWESPLKDSTNKNIALKICKNEGKIVITNIISEPYENIMQMYLDRYPSGNRAELSVISDQSGALSSNQGQWLKSKLKERATMFFPSGFPLSALEEILALQAKERLGQKTLRVELMAPQGFAYIQELKHALENINNLHIRDYQGKIIRISMGQI